MISTTQNAKTNKLFYSRALQIAPSCQPDDLKHYIYELKHSIVTKNTLFGHKETQNTLFYGQKFHNLRAKRTWSWVSSKWENIKRNVEPWSGWQAFFAPVYNSPNIPLSLGHKSRVKV